MSQQRYSPEFKDEGVSRIWTKRASDLREGSGLREEKESMASIVVCGARAWRRPRFHGRPPRAPTYAALAIIWVSESVLLVRVGIGLG